MDIVKVFGDNLRKYRNGLGLSQEAFADKCGLHRTYISAIECYRRSIALENVNVLLMLLGSKHINYLSKARNKNDLYT